MQLIGEIICSGNMVVEVDNLYDTRVVRGYEQIRGVRYRYVAHVPGGGSLLRYDNLHASTPDEFHRHEYDTTTWREMRRDVLTREQLPVFTEVIDEAMAIARHSGLV